MLMVGTSCSTVPPIDDTLPIVSNPAAARITQI